MHRFAVLLVIAAAIASGCGGAGDEAVGTTDESAARQPTTHETTTDSAETTPTETEAATAPEESERVRTGRRIFMEAGCDDCHTLAAAGTTGTVGPNLDDHLTGGHGGVAHVVMKVRQGGRGMPSFAGRLSEREIRKVARFVHRATAP